MEDKCDANRGSQKDIIEKRENGTIIIYNYIHERGVLYKNKDYILVAPMS